MTIDQQINDFVYPIAKTVEGIIFYAEPWSGYDVKLILLWLVAASIFLTLYLGFVNIRYFGLSINILRGKYDRNNERGQINRFSALMTSLSGTVGLGNIAGVAVAVTAGGPGAVFWMALMGLFGMSAKFAEAALGVKYRKKYIDQQGQEAIAGGPMYYLRAAFDRVNMPYIGIVLAGLFAICTVGGAIGAGNLFQSNQAYQQLVNVTGGAEGFWADKGWLFGLALAVLVGGVIIGGLKSISNVASKIVPFMGAVYLVAGLAVMVLNYNQIPAALGVIFTMALTPEAGVGAVLGSLLMGVQRAAFSNEAGIGSAAIVHAAARTDEPISQGFVGMLGPFIDTIVICMVTAFVIVITGAYEGVDGLGGVTITSQAFESVLPGFQYILAGIVFLFAYSTMIAWFYYGLKGLTYLFGDNKIIEMAYKVIFCLFTVVGASASLDSIIIFSDSMIFAMAIPNIIGLYFFAPELKRDLKAYLQRIEK